MSEDARPCRGWRVRRDQALGDDPAAAAAALSPISQRYQRWRSWRGRSRARPPGRPAMARSPRPTAAGVLARQDHRLRRANEDGEPIEGGGRIGGTAVRSSRASEGSGRAHLDVGIAAFGLRARIDIGTARARRSSPASTSSDTRGPRGRRRRTRGGSALLASHGRRGGSRAPSRKPACSRARSPGRSEPWITSRKSTWLNNVPFILRIDGRQARGFHQVDHLPETGPDGGRAPGPRQTPGGRRRSAPPRPMRHGGPPERQAPRQRPPRQQDITQARRERVGGRLGSETRGSARRRTGCRRTAAIVRSTSPRRSRDGP